VEEVPLSRSRDPKAIRRWVSLVAVLAAAATIALLLLMNAATAVP
jgi:hypothetical protein